MIEEAPELVARNVLHAMTTDDSATSMWRSSAQHVESEI
ncbi:hypothetical protein [Azospirillum endophyticum]